MAVKRATEFETLRVLHTLWKNKDLDTSKIIRYLKDAYELELTVLANEEISAQSEDGRVTYSIK